MNTVQKISKNVGLVFISQILTYILAFFTVIYTARYLGAGGFGVLSLGLSFGAIFGVFVDMGLSTLIVRELARDKSLSGKYIINSFLMKIILAIVTFALVFFTVQLIGYDPLESLIIYLITISVIISSFYTLLNAIFQADEKMEYLSLANIINSVVLLAGTLLGIYLGLNIVYFAWVYVITSIVVLVYCLAVYIKKFSGVDLDVDFSFWKPTIKEAWSFGIIFLSGMLYTYVDSIMLSILKGAEAVGWYSAAYRLMYIALLLPNAINTAVYPVMSRLFNDSSSESLKLLYERYFKYMLIAGIPLGLGTSILAKQVILLLYGTGFDESVAALQILVWTVVFTFAGASFTQLLQSINKQIIITKISLFCLCVNIVLNLILIPPYSYVGASIATLITEIVLVSYIIFITYKLGYGISYSAVVRDLSRILVATLVMGLFLWYFIYLNIFLLIVAGTIIYFVVLYLVKGIDDVDMDVIRKLRI
ncbi:MAG: flippase [Methanobacterium sp.]|nr:flippase [Methanobacterium sp.]